MPDAPVTIVEVGPRDGLQNEASPVPLATKRAFVEALAAAGLRRIEATSFVHPKAVPQLADAAELLEAVSWPAGVEASALVPNEKGLARALDVRERVPALERVAVFTAASDAFTRTNINMSVGESLAAFRPVVERARAAGLRVRGYVSTAVTCPYDGDVDPARVAEVAGDLGAMGCDEIAVSDTIGTAVPRDVERVLAHVTQTVPVEHLALHLHDTYGTALANVRAGLDAGVRVIDASAGGLGGCPYAPGAAGNLATEDLVYFLERSGIDTGVDLDRLFAASSIVAEALGRTLPGKNWQRLAAACRT